MSRGEPGSGVAVKAVIFDLDGTLVDSAPGIAAVFNRLMADRSAGALDATTVTTMIGDGAARLVERGLGALGLSVAAAEQGSLVETCKQMLAAASPNASAMCRRSSRD